MIRQAFRLGFPWTTFDPFLFCVHHADAYPAGNEAMGPDAKLLRGRNIGMDFEIRDGWRMYHGDVVPGFPRHPHRGFETVTIARDGFIDHSDSLGATARFGRGDCQWMTAGKGIVHAEMFPMVKTDAANPTELFQIWLNLPKADKMVDPYFTMLWDHSVPRVKHLDADGHLTQVTLTAGALDGHQPPKPPPNSWAARSEAEIAIWTIKMDPGARWTLPAAQGQPNRTLYLFKGDRVVVGEDEVPEGVGLRLNPSVPVVIRNDAEGSRGYAEMLMLQGRPIGEPVAHHGPFVMNTRQELEQAYQDYRKTQFGGWPWPADGPVHPRDKQRFAIHADGREERAPGHYE